MAAPGPPVMTAKWSLRSLRGEKEAKKYKRSCQTDMDQRGFIDMSGVGKGAYGAPLTGLVPSVSVSTAEHVSKTIGLILEVYRCALMKLSVNTERRHVEDCNHSSTMVNVAGRLTVD